MTRSNGRRSASRVLALCVGVVALLAVAVPAHAVLGAGSSMDCDDGNCITASGSVVDFVRSTPVFSGGVVVFACEASAPGALATTISQCYAGDVEAPQAGLVGPQAVTSGEFTTTDEDSYTICWEAFALFVNGPVTTTGCQQIDI